MIHVLIITPGGTVRTVPTDFVTASRIVRSATLAGKSAMIVPWSRSETREWTRQLDAGEALNAPITLFAGTCPCTVRPTREKIRALVPLGVIQHTGDGQSYFLEPLAAAPAAAASETVPQGTAPPNLPHGQATEDPDA